MILLRLSLPLLFLSSAVAVDFKKDIQPILEKNCYECHSEKTGKRKGGFVFDELDTFKLDIADNDVAQIRPGKPGESHFLEVIANPDEPRATQKEVWRYLAKALIETAKFTEALPAIANLLDIEDNPAWKADALLDRARAFFGLKRGRRR